MNRRRLAIVAAGAALVSALFAGQAWASGSFEWQANGLYSGGGFESRTWFSNGENNLALHTCNDYIDRWSGDVHLSVYHEHDVLPDVKVGELAWKCDNSYTWQSYPDGGPGDYHWTFNGELGPDGDVTNTVVDMTGSNSYN
ncbi:hypothetical protein [Streptomyces sp. YGL11-2]|uniref:hypothetical protein n=1 Tax=Streptomyces sp. YGL11-2 TaxID=3414028 RepID=UPI003CF5B99B